MKSSVCAPLACGSERMSRISDATRALYNQHARVLWRGRVH
jgi:hypothetical protein